MSEQGAQGSISTAEGSGVAPSSASEKQYVYLFAHNHHTPPKELKDLLGGKGANLAEMTTVLKLPVPPGFTVTTEACRHYMHHGWPEPLDAQIKHAVRELENMRLKRLGDAADPLLLSVRSGAKFSMPGMMDTVLNLGLNNETVEGLALLTQNDRFAYDAYRRFLSMFGRIVLGVDGTQFDSRFDAAMEVVGATRDSELPAEVLRGLCEQYVEVIERDTNAPFPADPREQLRLAVEAIFKSWNGDRAIAYREHEGISHELGTAVNVQSMVFGNRDDESGTGVAFTRNPATGENQPYGDFLVNAQGEDVVAGIRNTENLDAVAEKFPNAAKKLYDYMRRLERHYRDMCDTEFTIERGHLYMLQTRVGKRTGVAALRMAVEMSQDPEIALSTDEALMRIDESHLDQVLHPQFTNELHAVTKGLGASPGAAVGKVVFTADDAVEWHNRGEKVILVRNETSPDDIHGMVVCEGVLTARGGLVSHAAVVARGWGKPAVVGASTVVIEGKSARVGEQHIHEGDVISLDGTSGAIALGETPIALTDPPQHFHIVLGWADHRRRLGVRANADTGPDAATARKFGAQGIGLCRTEHMFLAEDRLPVVRRMILANTPEEEHDALEELRRVQVEDYVAILTEMDGLPVTVRLLDPPLHEFLPDVQSLAIKNATEGLSEEEHRLFAAAKQWHEVNPMLGTRGVRLGIIKPGLYAMQVRALLQAAKQRKDDGGNPIVEVMIPLTVNRAELDVAMGWVRDVLSEFANQGDADLARHVKVGTMIETPRAALRAAELAKSAEFFSFGTNDLTQMTFGFSRDDVEGRMMSAYLSQEILHVSPFDEVDRDGVGALVAMAVEASRAERPSIKLGICGEHGGNPESIEFFHQVGLDYVSCSPFRLPVARLAAAQAAIRG